MSEIKFRAYYQKISDDLWMIEGEYTLKDLTSRMITFDQERIEWVRCTGLKTTKGKEIGRKIYEGDVFRSEKEHDEGDYRVYHVVMWIEQRAAFYLVDVAHYPIIRDNDVSKEKDFNWLFEDADLYDFAIGVGLPYVGNIYENPELLK